MYYKYGHVSEQEWLERVKQISDSSLRAKIASIVWWDTVSLKDCDPSQKSLFDEYLKQPCLKSRRFDRKDVKQALLLVGYLEEDASRRSVKTDDA